MVRQVVRNVRPEVRMKLGIEAIRSIQARALDYRLLPIAPEARGVALADGGRARPLEATWAEHADGATLPQGVSRDALKQLGLQLLEEIKEREIAPIEA